MPVWAKLTPATGDIVVEAGAVFRGGGDAVSSSNTFPSIPLIDPDTLEFEMNVDGRVSSGGLGGPAILAAVARDDVADDARVSGRRRSQESAASPTSRNALNYFLLGCGTVQVCTAAMLDHAVGPNVIRRLIDGATAFLERHADRGWTHLRRLPRPGPRSRRRPFADSTPGDRRLPGRIRGGRIRGELRSSTRSRESAVSVASHVHSSCSQRHRRHLVRSL